MGWFIMAFVFTLSPVANAAPVVIFSSINSSGCVSNYNAALPINAMKLRATSTFSANIVRVAIGSQSVANFAGSSFYFMSHSTAGSAQGSPGTPLAVFTPDTITGTGSNTLANFAGNITITKGTVFWIAFGARTSVLPYCFRYPNTVTDLIMNSASVDTSTSLSNSSWARAQTTSNTSPVNATWATWLDQNLAYIFSIESSVLPQIGISISGPTASIYKSSVTLTATVDNPSKVSFYANRKPISGCRNINTSGGNVSCTWKPSVHGSNLVYASAIPLSDSFASNSSGILNVGVGKRTNNR